MAHIMIVDDDPDVRASLADIVRRAGHDVLTAGDGRSALVHMRVTKPDLLITDVIMPYTDGWTVIRSCRADPLLADILVLVMSGSTCMRSVAGQYGVDGFLLKPFDRATVLDEISRVLGL